MRRSPQMHTFVTTTKGEHMSAKRLTTLASAVLAAAMASPVGAAAQPSPTHFTAPYPNASTNTYTQCLTGTSCAPTATVAKENGRVAAGMTMSRDTNDQTATENGQGYGYVYVAVRTPAGKTSLTATFNWHVNSASSSVTATHGEVSAGSHLQAYASCGSCTVTSQLVTVNESRATANLPSTSPSGSVKDQEFQLALTISNLARNATITLYGQAAAYASMGTGTSCYVTPAGCVVVSPPDSGHAGAARSNIDATLTAIDLVYS